MSIIKDLYIEACEEIGSELEEAGKSLDDDKIGELAYKMAVDRFAALCDEAKDRAKYNNSKEGV
jgi:hypothetical protein